MRKKEIKKDSRIFVLRNKGWSFHQLKLGKTVSEGDLWKNISNIVIGN
jgi:hypothetical protein